MGKRIENSDNMCNICLEIIQQSYKVNITSSPNLNNIFQFNNFKEHLLLCIWCMIALKKAESFIKFMMESQEISAVDKRNRKNKPQGPYNLTIYNVGSIDIPPAPITEEVTTNQRTKESNIKKDLVFNYNAENDKATTTIDTNEDKNDHKFSLQNVKMEKSFHDKNMLMDLQKENIEAISNKNINSKKGIQDINVRKSNALGEMGGKMNHTQIKNRIKGRNKMSFYKENNFNVKYISIEEQLEEIKVKRASQKYLCKQFQCTDCGVGFVTKAIIDEHLLRHNESAGPYICEICHLRFKSQEVLSQHSLCHRRLFICVLCNIRFKRWSHCLAHRFKCGSVPRQCVCVYCRKLFSDEHSLYVHVKGVHEKEKKHVCEQCNECFVSKQRLIVHMRSHTGIKPFKCATCERSFTTNSNLRSHLSVHDDARPHYCVECDRFYKTRRGLKKHLTESLKHSGDILLPYECTKCTKRFLSERTLGTHIKVRHLTTYSCSVCNKIFSSNANMKKHKRSVHATVKIDDANIIKSVNTNL